MFLRPQERHMSLAAPPLPSEMEGRGGRGEGDGVRVDVS